MANDSLVGCLCEVDITLLHSATVTLHRWCRKAVSNFWNRINYNNNYMSHSRITVCLFDIWVTH